MRWRLLLAASSVAFFAWAWLWGPCSLFTPGDFQPFFFPDRCEGQ